MRFDVTTDSFLFGILIWAIRSLIPHLPRWHPSAARGFSEVCGKSARLMFIFRLVSDHHPPFRQSCPPSGAGLGVSDRAVGLPSGLIFVSSDRGPEPVKRRVAPRQAASDAPTHARQGAH